jgi:hypothetical protein
MSGDNLHSRSTLSWRGAQLKKSTGKTLRLLIIIIIIIIIIIKLDVRETGCNNVDWIHVVQDKEQWLAVVNTVTNHSGSIKVREFLD